MKEKTAEPACSRRERKNKIHETKCTQISAELKEKTTDEI